MWNRSGGPLPQWNDDPTEDRRTFSVTGYDSFLPHGLKGTVYLLTEFSESLHLYNLTFIIYKYTPGLWEVS